MIRFSLFICFIFFAFSIQAEISLATRLKSATKDYEAGRFDNVIATLDPYAEELPKPGLMMLASAFSKKGQFEREVHVLHALVSKDDTNYEAHMLLAQGLLKQSSTVTDHDALKKIQIQAIQSFRQCLKLRPKFKPAFDELLATLIDEKDDADARDLLQEGLDRFGRRPEYLKEMCRLDSMNGFVVQAVQSCREAIRLAPAYPDNYVYLVQSLTDQRENPTAEHEIIVAAKRFPASEFVQWAAGTVFFKKKDFPVAARYFGQAVHADPASGRSQMNYAQALFENGQEAQALPIFQKACQLDPGAVSETLFAASSRLRQKGNSMGEKYKESAATCHAR